MLSSQFLIQFNFFHIIPTMLIHLYCYLMNNHMKPLSSSKLFSEGWYLRDPKITVLIYNVTSCRMLTLFPEDDDDDWRLTATFMQMVG